MDLAKGHIAALRKLKEQCGCRVGGEGRSGGDGDRGGDQWGPEGSQCTPTAISALLSWADLQPGHGNRLFGATDGPGHGEGLREEGRLAAHPAPPPAPHTNIPDGHLSPTVYSSLPEALTPKSETLLHTSISGGLVSNLVGDARAGSARLQPPPLLQIPYKVVARREGDVAACYANPSLALKELGWSAALGLDRMCECSP